MDVSTRDGKRPGRPRDLGNDLAILDAAEQLLGRGGFEAMTMEQVARTAGVSKPTLYLRFRSKHELVAAMIDRLRPPLPSGSIGSVTADLKGLIDMQHQWTEDHGVGIVAAVLLEQAEHPELMGRFRQRVVEPVRDAFRLVLRAGIERRELVDGADDDVVIDALTGAYWARTWTVVGERRDWSRRLIHTMLTGLHAPTASRRRVAPSRTAILSRGGICQD